MLGLTGPADRLSDEYRAGMIVLILGALELDPVHARYGAAALYGANARHGFTVWYEAAPVSKNRHQKPDLHLHYKLPHDMNLRADENSNQ